jgi:hypothetical protein
MEVNHMWLLIAAFLVLVVGTIIGSRYSIKLFKENHPKKYIPFAIFFAIALISELVYFFGTKKIHPGLDVLLSWMVLNMGLFFASGIVYFSAFLSKK